MEWDSYLRTLFALVFVLVLICALTWFLRRVNQSRLLRGGKGGKRVAISDIVSVDGKRKLVLVRRDNVEHLLLIGGATDIVVESGIGASGETNQNHDAKGA